MSLAKIQGTPHTIFKIPPKIKIAKRVSGEQGQNSNYTMRFFFFF